MNNPIRAGWFPDPQSASLEAAPTLWIGMRVGVAWRFLQPGVPASSICPSVASRRGSPLHSQRFRRCAPDLSAPTRHPEIFGLLVKLPIPQQIVEPHPGFVQPSPPEVPDKESGYGIYSVRRLGPCASADARATGSPNTVLEGHALLCVYLPREYSRCIALV